MRLIALCTQNKMLTSENKRCLFIFSMGTSRLPSLDAECVEKRDVEGVNWKEVSPPLPSLGLRPQVSWQSSRV